MSESQYKLFSYALSSKGLSARLSIDHTPPDMYWNLLGLEVRQENTLSSRLGRIPITATSGGTVPAPLADTNVHTLARLKGVAGNTWRYAGAGQNIYRITGDAQGAYVVVSATNQLSGNRFSAATYRPNFSSFPYIFFADSNVMLKDNGQFNPLQQMGIFPPVIPAAAEIAGFLANEIDNFGSPTFYVVNLSGATNFRNYSNITAPVSLSISTVVRTRVPLPSTRTTVLVTTTAPHGLTLGQEVILGGVTDPSFDGNFTVNQINGSTSFTSVVGTAFSASSSGGTVTSYQKFVKVSTTVSAISQNGVLVTIRPASMTNIVVGLVLSIFGAQSSQTGGFLVTAVTGSTFSFNLPFSGPSGISIGNPIVAGPFYGTIASSKTASITGIGSFNLDVLGSTQATDSDVISCFFNFSTMANLTSVTIEFDVGDGTFTDYYSAPVTLGGFTGGVWGQFSLARGSFTKNGRAGLTGFNWATVNSYQVVIVTNSSGSVIAQMDSLYMTAVGGPNTGSGSQYDYRYTYWNNVTGDESNPSQIMSYTVNPSSQPVIVTIVPSTDPQVTNINVYRRGGTLNVGWTFVAQIPANSTSFVDQSSDAQIASDNLLELDNDVPLTTTLTTPVNTNLGTNVTAVSTQTVTPGSMVNIFPNQRITVDSGNNQEIVVVQSVTPTTFTAYFQLAHSISTPITASTRSGHAVNLMTIAFDIAWFAGDPDNPNRLYYSKATNPEAVPPQNWIEIGTPSDPIMAIVFFNGQLFVFTQSRVYRVIIPYAGATPTPYPTASRHGLFANFGFSISEGLIPYLSKDGIYIFQGSISQYATEVIEWLFADKEPNLGPIPAQAPATAQNTIMAFTKNEFYVSYLDVNGIQRRVSYDFKASRWRNDDVPATAMFYEEDTDELVIGDQNGMIYRDRRGDFYISPNAGGTAFVNTPINISLQTGAQDQGFPNNDKSYNELTLDMDCPDPVNVSLIFDDGKSTPLVVATNVTTTGRQRLYIPINAGVGQLSKNVILLISGGVGITGPAHFYYWHIKAAVEAEWRESFDSYWIKFGTDEFKFIKQGWFEYQAPDPAGISFAVYTEGNMTTPVFTFNLPQATVRTARRVRFPATKGKVWRMIGTSPSKFRLYGESFVEWKPVTTAKGYAKENLGAMISAQGSV